jgi:tRNA 2-thiouridine synthesizing protein A
VPTLRLRRASETAEPGALLRLLSDDPMARVDVSHFAVQAGLELLEMKVDGSEITVLLRKPGP